MKMSAPMKEATTAPLTRWQKSLNCWQMANQFVLEFPLCAKYTIAAAAEAADVVTATITCIFHTSLYQSVFFITQASGPSSLAHRYIGKFSCDFFFPRKNEVRTITLLHD